MRKRVSERDIEIKKGMDGKRKKEIEREIEADRKTDSPRQKMGE